MTKKRKKTMALIILLIFIAAVFAVVPPSSGRLPQFRDENGDIIEGSIAERIKLPTDDGTLELMLLGRKKDAPVLMVCGGGPGIPQYLLEDLYPSVLPDFFTVCYWEYRGTCSHYDRSIVPGDMDTDRYVSDALTVTEYLRDRFSQDKIYIMGHSFGTYIALRVVQAHPENYTAYIAMSQICDQRESEYMAYDRMIEAYENKGDSKAAQRLRDADIKSSDEKFISYCGSMTRDKSMHELGVGTTRNMHSVITQIFFPSLRCSAYTQAERINIWRNKKRSHGYAVTDESHSFNAFEDVPEAEIPVYFIVGRYDLTCCADLQRKYYEQLRTPDKEIYEFENSAHSPLYEEPERAEEVLDEIISRTK
ncbi:MAG: alpha/beta hydrolase [Oscillospiraceae bacterium]|nr:alpha/beta hydrolase [Oscillospiraceae bacterium]